MLPEELIPKSKVVALADPPNFLINNLAYVVPPPFVTEVNPATPDPVPVELT